MHFTSLTLTPDILTKFKKQLLLKKYLFKRCASVGEL